VAPTVDEGLAVRGTAVELRTGAFSGAFAVSDSNSSLV
jgi:hypothetical protein